MGPMHLSYARTLSLVCALSVLGACGDDDAPGADAPVNPADASTLDGPVLDGSVQPDGAVVVDGPALDAAAPDDGGIGNDAACVGPTCSNPVDDGCVDAEACGDGLDNNCNGAVDEGCSCTRGAVQPCFLGPPGRRGVGACEDGHQTCSGDVEFTHWGPCEGGIWPAPEQCDTQDNDCNGCSDDHPNCCSPDLVCPGPGDLPEASPFEDYVIDGTDFWGGAATSWSWTVTGGPCDQLLLATSGSSSYTLSGTNSSHLRFHPTLSGDYTVTMTVLTSDGVKTCTFIVHVRGPGLRFELCWDTTGSSDIDFHLHRPGTTTNWFTGGDDCYYATCKANDFLYPDSSDPEWGYADSSLAECSGGPEGDDWIDVGFCHNPRLDIDNISTDGIPENINVDNPAHGDMFRVMVHYYGGSVLTHPMVNVYCGGYLKGTYGAAPDLVPGFTSGGGNNRGPMWRVADVKALGGGTNTGCSIAPLHLPTDPSAYFVTNNDPTF